ncbi:MAG: phosphonate ABC transporter ATP-binding protein [Nitriliruptoraceae bacterium]
MTSHDPSNRVDDRIPREPGVTGREHQSDLAKPRVTLPRDDPAFARIVTAGNPAATVVRARDLAVHFGEIHALDGVDLEVRDGEFIALLGHSGSGKSTFLRSINGLVEPTRGTLEVAGRTLPGLGRDELRGLRGDVGFVFQQFNLVPRLSALTNVLVGGLPDSRVVPSLAYRFSREQRRRALELLGQIGLLPRATQQVRHLSGGEQQRVGIARALMQQPSIVLADEPVASLDPKLAGSVLEDLRRLARERGIPVIASLHVVALARRFADRVVALSDGKVVFDGPSHDFTDEEVRRTYGYADEYGTE